MASLLVRIDYDDSTHLDPYEVMDVVNEMLDIARDVVADATAVKFTRAVDVTTPTTFASEAP